MKLPCGCDLFGEYGCDACYDRSMTAYDIALGVWIWYQDDIYDNPKYQRKPVPKFSEWCLEHIVEELRSKDESEKREEN